MNRMIMVIMMKMMIMMIMMIIMIMMIMMIMMIITHLILDNPLSTLREERGLVGLWSSPL